MPYMQKFMKQYGSKIQEIFENVQIKKSVKAQNAKVAQLTLKQKTKSQDSTNEDTMKTIKSNFEQTGSNSGTLNTGTLENKSLKQDTLDYSMTGMTAKDRIRMKK